MYSVKTQIRKMPRSEIFTFWTGTPSVFSLIFFCGITTRPMSNIIHKKSTLHLLGARKKSNNCQKQLNLNDGGQELYILRIVVAHSHLQCFKDKLLYLGVLFRHFCSCLVSKGNREERTSSLARWLEADSSSLMCRSFWRSIPPDLEVYSPRTA